MVAEPGRGGSAGTTALRGFYHIWRSRSEQVGGSGGADQSLLEVHSLLLVENPSQSVRWIVEQQTILHLAVDK